jgi:hypothetical protein
MPVITIEPLSKEEIREGLEAIEQSRVLGKAILKRRKGKPVPPAWKLMRQEREERSKRI